MVTLEEANSHLRRTVVKSDNQGGSSILEHEDDIAITQMIAAAVDHLQSIDIDMSADPLPPALHHAILLLVGHFFDNRQLMTEGANKVMPYGVSRLIAPYRSITL